MAERLVIDDIAVAGDQGDGAGNIAIVDVADDRIVDPQQPLRYETCRFR